MATTRRGITLLDLLEVPPGSQGLLPPDIALEFESVTVVDHRSTISGGAYVHHGTILADDELKLPLGIQVPGLNTGLPFQLTLFRVAASGAQNLEPAHSRLQLDLMLSRVAIQVPGLRPARFVDAAGTNPAHLVPDLSRTLVRIVGSGVLRIRVQGSNVDVLFIDRPDPIDVAAPTGAAFGLTFDPPHFFIGSSEFGMTVDRLTYDASDTFTPAEIAARGHDAAWQGILLREAMLYLPPGAPLLGDISVGVRDVILGKPAGIQGELRIEFGHAIVPAFLPTFQRIPATGSPVAMAVEGTDRARTVRIPADQTRVRVRAALATGSARWFPPNDPPSTGSSVEFFARRGDVLRAQPMAGDQATAEVLFTFREEAVTSTTSTAAAAVALPAPLIEIVRAPGGAAPQVAFRDVASISGAPENLRSLTFRAFRGTSAVATNIDWRIEGVQNSVTRNATYSSAAMSFPREVGRTFQLVLTEYATAGQQRIERRRRLQIEVRAEGNLLVGARDGIHDANSATANVVAGPPLRTLHLRSFEEDGAFVEAQGTATQIDASITAPPGTLVELAVNEPGTPATSTPASATAHANLGRWNHIEMLTGTTFAVSDSAFDEVVRRVASYGPTAKHLVVGRTDDLWAGHPYMSSDALLRNKELAQERAQTVKNRLVAAGIANGQVHAAGEQDDSSALPAGFTPAAPVPVPAPWPPASEGVTPPNAYGLPGLSGAGANRFLIKRRYPHLTGNEGRDIPERVQARRVDIFTMDGAPSNPDTSGTQPATEPDRTSRNRRFLLVPGVDATVPAPPAQVTRQRDNASTPQYRVRIRVVWDSPTVVSLADAIPTLAEVTVAWAMGQVPLPSVPATGAVTGIAAGSTAQIQHGNGTPATSTEVWTLVGQWSTDPRTGQTLFSLALNSTGDPEGGLFSFGSARPTDPANMLNAICATGFALGPAIIAGAQIDPGSPGVKISALLLALGLAPLLVKNGKVIFHGIKVERRQRSLTNFEHGSFAVLLDYSAEVLIDTSRIPLPLSARTRTRGLRVRYRNVGVIIDHAPVEAGDPPRDWYDRIKVVYDDASFEVENPGDWEISGALGQLLRVTATRAGTGSTWIELDLVFALDLGVITITGATLRFTLSGGEWRVELRGLGVKVQIEKVLIGEGKLQIGAGGAFSATIDVLIVPTKVQARASMRYEHPNFFLLEVGVIFPTAIPITPGLGIYGFMGRFVSNGSRLLPPGADPIQRELDWFKNPTPPVKYERKPGQWALGLGAVVGTLPDSAYTFNAAGMLVVEFPDPSVIFGIDAFLLQEKKIPSSGGNGSTTSPTLNITGVIVIDREAVKVGVRGRYLIPRTLDLRVPISGYFPFTSTPANPSYLRVGADNAGSPLRAGDPVSLTILPDTLNQRAWAYLMVEQYGLANLGGESRLPALQGFSIGLGIGAALEWGPRAVHLSASMSLLLGLGTKPFMLVGLLRISGELRLVIVSIAASAELLLTIREMPTGNVFVHLEGELCGRVDFFFFSVKGCVRFAIGDAVSATPEAVPPLTGIDLVDRRAILTGRATTLPAAPRTSDPDTNATVWPDTIPVLKFAHFVDQQLTTGSQFEARLARPSPSGYWWGSDQLKYAYRLLDVKLTDAAGAVVPGPLDASWWLPASRPGVAADVPNEISPSTHEGRDLALLTWHPALWARNLGPDANTLPGDPAKTIDRVCSPTPQPQRNCALGALAKRDGPDAVELRPAAATPHPFPNWFEVKARETYNGVSVSHVAVLSSMERTFFGGSVMTEADSGEKVYRLPMIHRYGQFESTLQFDAILAPSLEWPDLTLIVAADKPVQICDTYRDLQLPPPMELAPAYFGPNLGHGGFIYECEEGVNTVVTSDPKVGSVNVDLQLKSKPMIVTLPSAGTSVKVYPVQDAPLAQFRVEAYDAAGNLVDTAFVGGEQAVTHLTVTGEGIRKVAIYAYGESRLRRVCYDGLKAANPEQLPVVTGTLADGTTRVWPVVETKPAGQGFSQRVRYAADVAGPWTNVRIDRYSIGRVHLLSICGVSSDAAQAARDDQQARNAIIADFRSHALVPARSTLLEPGKTYQIAVTWQAQTWVKSDAQPQPPAVPDASRWGPRQTVFYRFAVATEPPLPASAPPPALISEDSFDARGASRYVLGFVPGDGVGVPHFLDDTVSVYFSVDHLKPLMAKYGRTLDVRVFHTNPPAGSLRGVTEAPRLPSTLTIVPSAALLGPADRRIADAAKRAPCIGRAPNLGESRGDVEVSLLPDAEYDVVLVAAKTGSDVNVARAHFRTSRYRNARQFLDALGFPAAGAGPLPYDFVTGAAVPATAPPGNDAAFESALRSLGMDPWPAPTEPRVTAIWQNTATGGWRVAAILVESPEPLKRGARLPHVPLFAEAPPSIFLEQALLQAGTTVTRFSPRFANGTFTAMLLAPASGPVSSAQGARITLFLRTPSGAITGSRTLNRAPMEVLLEEES